MIHMRFDPIELAGWVGTLLILSAYALVSFGWLAASHVAYPLMNAFGSLGIILVSFRKKAYQPGILNVIWVGIALAALIRILL